MRRTEQNFQRTVVEYLDRVLPVSAWFSAIGHGGGGRVRGAILKGMGVKAGLPDMIVLWNCRCIGLEFKANRGVQSPAQKACQAAWRAAGTPYAVCRTLEEVELTLRGWNIPLRGMIRSMDGAE